MVVGIDKFIYVCVYDASELRKYSVEQLGQCRAPERLYYGYTFDEVIRSGRDILAESALKCGEPGWETVEGVLPRLECGAYAVLGSHVGWSGITVDPDGSLRAQRNHKELPPRYIFRPSQIDAELGGIEPTKLLLDGVMPVLISVHSGEVRTLELMHYVEPGDTGKDPTVWTRALTIDNGSARILTEKLMISGLDMMTEAGSATVDAEMFWDAFTATALYWERYKSSYARLDLPDEKLKRAVYGCLGTMAVTFSADHPHYGHEGYGWEIHDHFPPAAITAFETSASLNNLDYARRILNHLLTYAIDDGGRFYYRQGASYLSGAAGSEYGQLLWVVERYAGVLNPAGDWFQSCLVKLRLIGDMLIRNRQPSHAEPDLRLIRMCAEADTNGRIYDYLQNSFWCALGLRALSKLLDSLKLNGGERYAAEAEELLVHAKEAVRRMRVDTRFGPLPPFQLDYTATPLTLSNCRDTFEPLDDEAYARYLNVNDFREPLPDGQNYVENVYANYRYYLEMLASRCLLEEEERAIVRLREELGGELLGTTRFLDRMDDWPVYNYARYLLETDLIDKYLLLLYAHTEHHGLPELMVYYEQAGAQGEVYAPDCVPTLLTTPLMVSWMFAFESVKEEALYLLRAVPDRWFREGFSIADVCTRWGRLSLNATPDSEGVTLSIDLPEIPEKTPVFVNLPRGGELSPESTEHLLSIDAERAAIKPRLRSATLRLVWG